MIDEQSSASGHDYASDRSAIGAALWESQRRARLPLADTDITFPAATGEIGSVTIGMTNRADATPMNDRNSYDSHNGPVLTDMWFRGETSIRNDWPAMLIRSVSCDPLDVRYAMLADDHRKVFKNFSSDQVCPVVPDIHDLGKT